MEKIKASVTYEPFTSIDIETTGLDPKHCQILEVGVAFYDGIHKEPVSELQFICMPDGYDLLDTEYHIKGQPYGTMMNVKILQEIMDAQKKALKEHPEWGGKMPEYECLFTENTVEIMNVCEAMDYLYTWLDFIQVTHKLKKKNILAGKNLNSLDIPFLKRAMGEEKWDKVVSYRSLDLTSMFAPFSRKTSPLKDINALRGLGDVSHRALQDAKETGAAIIDIYEKNLQW